MMSEKSLEEDGSVKEDINSEVVTGVGSDVDQGNGDGLSSDMSDTGWDTDLEIEEEKEQYDPTGKTTYTKICSSLGIIPASYFIRKLLSGDSHINMAHHGVGTKGAKAIAMSLTSNTSITHLDLSDNGMQTESSIAITIMMKENCYITHLDISDNDLGSPAAYSVAQMTSYNSTLTHLYLRGNGFDDKAAEPLAMMIQTSYHLKHIDLSHNKLGEVSGVIFGPAIGESETIQFLDLSWNIFRRKGAGAIAEGLKSNNALRKLNLAYNGFADEGVGALAVALKLNSTLVELDVSNNRVTQAGAIALSKVIPSHDSMQVLKIGKNHIQPPGLVALLKAVQANPSCGLQCLDLHAITLTLDLERMVEELKKSHTHLRVEHAGVGGFKTPKPLLPPVVKLEEYCKKENVKLEDLCFLFDKDRKKLLSEEEFRGALKHINAPLMEFERKKLMIEYKVRPPGSKERIESAKTAEEEPIFFDYMKMLAVIKGLKTGEIKLI